MIANRPPAPPASAPPEPSPLPLAACRAAIVHDWLLTMRGGEWVLASLLKLFPLATVHTLFYDPRGVRTVINRHAVRPSVLDALPGVRHYYRHLLPLFPWVTGAMRVDPRAELVLSVSHCVAHGVRPPAGVPHVVYCLSPMRYVYDQQAAYATAGPLARRTLAALAPRLRRWDRAAGQRADGVLAISQFVARRIEAAWGRTAQVVYPPVRTDVFTPPREPKRGREFLLVSALTPYKRVETAIEAANRLGFPLRIVGDGPMRGVLRRLAGPTVALEGRVGERRLLELYRTARALIFTAEEDFGLVPLEAMACGTPVLGLRAGGLLETLVPGVCGEFYDRPDADSLAEAWRAFRPEAYDPAALRAHAERFGEAPFLRHMAEALRPFLPQRR